MNNWYGIGSNDLLVIQHFHNKMTHNASIKYTNNTKHVSKC